jgi:cytochrome c oxidase subunit 2
MMRKSGIATLSSLCWISSAALGLGAWLASAVAWAQKSFDDMPYKIDGGFNSPMTTISGLTEWSRDINHVYLITTVIVTGIFFAVAIPLIYTLYRFRAKEGDDTPPEQVHGNVVLEFLWTVVPVVLLIFIAVPTWKYIFKHEGTPVRADAVKVHVIGHQWWWEFQYPDYGIKTAFELHLPESTPVELTITSADVSHAFWIPKFGGKTSAINGNTNRLAFTTPAATQPEVAGGDYYQGQCAELCGSSHALMRHVGVVHTKEGFERWVKAHNTPPKVETASQRDGEAAFAKCVACHVIEGTPSASIPGDKIGPNLSNFGSRSHVAAGIRKNTEENLAIWLRNPADLKPGALMPNLGLTDQEITSLSAYLRQSTYKTY